MNSEKTKFFIIDAGAVGSSIAFDLSIQNICDEIVPIDRNKEKANMLSIGTRSVQTFTMGEHGDSQFTPRSPATVGGKKFTDIISDRKGQFALVNYDEVLNEIKETAFKIGKVKRATNRAIAASVAKRPTGS